MMVPSRLGRLVGWRRRRDARAGPRLGVLLMLAGVLMSSVSGAVRSDFSRSNDFIVLFPVEVLAVLVGGGAAVAALRTRRDQAGGFLGVGLYVLLVAGTVSTAYPIWLPNDNTILGAALLGGELAWVGASLALTSAAALAGWSSGRAFLLGAVGGGVAGLLVLGGGSVSPLFALRLPLVAVALAGAGALLLAARRGGPVLRALALALAGGAVTIVLLLVRGPDDWASGSTSVRLYSLPILVVALGMSLAMVDRVPRPAATPLREI